MVKVEICGITNLEDALCAVKNGADALGFVFYEKSSRYITPQKALAIVKQLPPFVQKVGLFVNVSAKEINATCKQAQMSLAQIHFEADESLYKSLEVPYIRVIRATCKEDIKQFSNEYRIVDAFVPSYGGEGKRVDISWFSGIDCSKIILAGGLNAQNIEELMSFDFYGFDVSSGVEETKGKKDSKKIMEFLQRAKG